MCFFIFKSRDFFIELSSSHKLHCWTKKWFFKIFFIWYYMIYVIFDSTFSMSKHRMNAVHDTLVEAVIYRLILTRCWIHIENQLCEYDIKKNFRCKIRHDMNHYLSRCEPFWPDYFCLPSSEFKTAVANNKFFGV